MNRQFGRCAAVAGSFESFCAVSFSRHLVVALRSDVGSPCVRTWTLGSGKCVCVCVCGQYKSLDTSLCLGVGEVSAALLARSARKALAYSRWAWRTLPEGPGRHGVSGWLMAVTELRGRLEKGKGSGTVAYAQHPPPQRSWGNKKRRGLGRERGERWEVERTWERERERFIMLIDG